MDGSRISEMLAAVRARLARVGPGDLEGILAKGGLVVDTRPEAQRRRDGELPGAIVVDRNVLEWRLDPTSPHRIPEIRGHHQTVVVVCDEGYSSSLAAAGLQDLGLVNATDLAGGYQAWLRHMSGGSLTRAGPSTWPASLGQAGPRRLA